MESETKMDEKGRICIPLEIRKKIDLKPGEKIMVRIEKDKLILQRAVSSEEFVKRARRLQDHLDDITTEPLVVKKLF